jgi:hypothetical protein
VMAAVGSSNDDVRNHLAFEPLRRQREEDVLVTIQALLDPR